MNPLLIYRTPWQLQFPNVLIHAPESNVKKHDAYVRAKQGNLDEAVRLTRSMLSVDQILEMRRLSDFKPVLMSVHAEEATGRNAIPEVMADVLGRLLGWPVESTVVQANIVNHTGANGFIRMARQAVFEGEITANCNYVIVDDFIGQGGTIANLRGHIQAGGGTVIGATVLTGKPFSAVLALTTETLNELRNQHGQLEQWWTERFGFAFDCLTQSEARYLCNTADVDTIRNRILESA
jgi:hypothetical protein